MTALAIVIAAIIIVEALAFAWLAWEARRAQDGEHAERDAGALQEERVKPGREIRVAHDEREQEQDQRHAEHLSEESHGPEDA